MQKNKMALAFISTLYLVHYKVDAREYNPETFLKPITLTNEGISYFAKCYNHSYFTKRFLPTCFLPITDLLAFAEGQKDPYGYTCIVLDLFHQRFKDCHWNNPFALADLLEKLPDLLGPLFEGTDNDSEDLKAILYKQFSDKGELLKKNPTEFINLLTEDIEGHFHFRTRKKEVHTILTRFLESVLDKVIWDYKDEIFVWKSFLMIGSHLENLYERQILPDQTVLNHLLWSLIYRFSYFLDLSAAGLPVEVYEEMKNDLLEERITFLKYEEQENFTFSKKHILARSIKLGEAKSRAYQKGILMSST